MSIDFFVILVYTYIRTREGKPTKTRKEQKVMLTTKMISNAINEAIEFGDAFLGDMSFDVIRDTKKVNNYIKNNADENIFLVYFDENDNVKDHFGAPAIGWYIIAK